MSTRWVTTHFSIYLTPLSLPDTFNVVTRRIQHQSEYSLHSCPPTSRFQPYTWPCSFSECCRQALIAAISTLTQLFPHKRDKIINTDPSAGSSTARWKRPVHCFHCIIQAADYTFYGRGGAVRITLSDHVRVPRLRSVRRTKVGGR